MESREVNGQPGAIIRDRDDKVVSTMTLDALGGRIQTIRSVVSPNKLGHLGPVADAWAVAREVKQARRPDDCTCVLEPAGAGAHALRPTGFRAYGLRYRVVPSRLVLLFSLRSPRRGARPPRRRP